MTYQAPRMYRSPRWIVRHPIWFWWAVRNWLRGFAFQPVSRCRECGHTAYRPDHCRPDDTHRPPTEGGEQ